MQTKLNQRIVEENVYIFQNEMGKLKVICFSY